MCNSSIKSYVHINFDDNSKNKKTYKLGMIPFITPAMGKNIQMKVVQYAVHHDHDPSVVKNDVSLFCENLGQSNYFSLEGNSSVCLLSLSDSQSEYPVYYLNQIPNELTVSVYNNTPNPTSWTKIHALLEFSFFDEKLDVEAVKKVFI